MLGLSEALGLVEPDGLVDADGDRDRLDEAEGLSEPDGEVEELGEIEADGETDADGLREADGEIKVPARRAVTEEPAERGFHRHTKRIRPEVIAATATVTVISRLIAKTGKLVVVLAMKVAWGLVPVHISSVFS